MVTFDGLPNLMKYALGLDPTVEAGAAEQPSRSGFPPLAVSFRRARDVSDVTLAVQATDDLTGLWTNLWTSPTNAFGGGSNAFETITVTDPAPVGSVPSGRFLRLNVSRP